METESKPCFCDHTNSRLEDLRPGDTAKGESHGAPYCRRCDGIILCDFCPAERRRVADVLTPRNYACWEHGDVAFDE